MNYWRCRDVDLFGCNSYALENSIRIASCMLLFWCASVTGQENRPGSPASDAVEQEALKVVNESDWAHTVTPTTQDTPCTHQNPAFSGLYPVDEAVVADERDPAVPTEVVKPDTSEYLIRFQSAKPVQTAIQHLVAMGEKWSAYDAKKRQVSETDGPTDVANYRYNVADMITIAVILKHPGPDGTTLFDYVFEDGGRSFPSHSFHVWPCAGLRTSNGQVFAHVVPAAFGQPGQPHALQLSFPRLLDGKPLISSLREKVEFRMVANQRVFETTFYINASDVLDGSEKLLYLPSAFTDSKEMARQ
jgi:hypothetical protein